MDFTKMTANDIRQSIYDTYQVDASNIKGKTNLVNKYKELSGETLIMTNSFDLNKTDVTDFKIEGIDFSEDNTDNNQETLKRSHRGWTKFILDQLDEDEKDGEFPKSDGLRRLLELNVSPITSIQTHIIQPPTPDNNMIATARSTICLENGEIYEACADAQQSMLPAPYDRYVTAIAETRSEGRVYRKALRLKNTVTKEEINVETSSQGEGFINNTQITVIDTLCGNGKLNINVSKFLENLLNKSVTIKTLSHSDAIKAIQALQEYQKNPDSINSDLRGYSPSWKD